MKTVLKTVAITVVAMFAGIFVITALIRFSLWCDWLFGLTRAHQ